MFILGIDYGTKNIGIALGNSEMRLATPLGVFKKDKKFFVEYLVGLIKNYSIEAVVWGLPKTKNQSSECNIMIEEIEKFSLEVSLKTKTKRYLVNEALTTYVLPKNLKDKDSMAATIILQDFINNQKIYR